MTETERVCKSCEEQIDEDVTYCPECGEKSPQQQRPKFDWERDVELPIIFSYEVYEDNYGLWDSLCHSTFGTSLGGCRIANLPDGLPRMKYCTTTLYFKLTEEYELSGPFLDRQEARKA